MTPLRRRIIEDMNFRSFAPMTRRKGAVGPGYEVVDGSGIDLGRRSAGFLLALYSR